MFLHIRHLVFDCTNQVKNIQILCIQEGLNNFTNKIIFSITPDFLSRVIFGILYKIYKN